MRNVKGPPSTDPPVGVDANESLVVYEQNEPGSAIVLFVHGLGGSAYGSSATWGQFPLLVYGDLPDVGVGLYRYASLHRRRPFRSHSLRGEARVLADVLAKDLPSAGYSRCVLVGHSLGGLLCKAAIKVLVDDGDEASLRRIAGLILMATPQTGSQRVPWFLRWTSDGRALSPHSQWATELAETFKSRIATGDAGEPERFTIPTWTVRAANDIWVDRLSAGLDLSADRILDVRGTHTSIVKPPDRQSDSYVWVRDRISQSLAQLFDATVERSSKVIRKVARGERITALLDLSRGQSGWHGHVERWAGDVATYPLMSDSRLLDKTDVLISALPRGRQHREEILAPEFCDRIEKWVAAGHGLLFMGYYAADTHHFSNPSALAQRFRVSFEDDLALATESTEMPEDELQKELARSAHLQAFDTSGRFAVPGITASDPGHPILDGVRDIRFLSSCSLDLQGDTNRQLVLSTPATTAVMRPRGPRDDDGWRVKIDWEVARVGAVPVLAAFDHGSGRVVITGTWKLGVFHLGDNDTLFANLVRWLGAPARQRS